MAYGNNLYIEPLQDNGCVVSVYLPNTTAFTVNLQYSFNNSTWNEYTSGKELAIEYGSKVYFKGSNNLISLESDKTKFSITGGSTKVGGNVMGLMDDGKCELNELFYTYSFSDLFKNCTSITNVEEGLLPATTISKYCYYQMFYGCTSLINAPELPANTLKDYCYCNMFYGCTSLVTAPDLQATTLANECYQAMFQGCTSLVTAPALPATTLAYACYVAMFKGCFSLVNAPALPATTLTNSCYEQMFFGCISLKKAPSLPAEILTGACYRNMFNGCKSLVTPPDVRFHTNADYSCYGMFEECSKLEYSPLLNCDVKNYCYCRMFYNCESLKRITMLGSGITIAVKQKAFTDWTYGVPSGGWYFKNPNQDSTYCGAPSRWNVVSHTGSLVLRGSNCSLYINSDNYSDTDYIYFSYASCFQPTISAIPNNGYRFVCWDDLDKSPSRDIVCSDGIKEYTAKIVKENSILVYIKPNSKCGIVGNDKEVTVGQGAYLLCVPNSGYEFVKWVVNGNNYIGSGYNPWDILELGTDWLGEVYLQTPSYTVSLGGSHCTLTGGGTYESGKSVTISCTPDTGYQFVKWSDGNTNATRTITVNKDYYLIATVEEVEVTKYTVSVTGTNCTIVGNGEYVAGSDVTLSCIPNDGYKFNKWMVNSRYSTSNPYNISDLQTNITGSCIVEAVEATKYTVTLNCENGTVTGAGQYDAGSIVTISCTPNTNYEFEQWSDGNTNQTRTITVNSNISLTAILVEVIAPTYYTITINNKVNCRVIGDKSYAEGESAQLTCIPNEGYKFVKWTLEGRDYSGDANNPLDILEVGANLTGSVYVEPITPTAYKIALNGTNCTFTKSPDKLTYAYGDVVSITCVPNDNCTFVSWNDDVTTATRSITVTGDTYYSAYCKENGEEKTTYTVTLNGNNCTLYGAGTFESGSTEIISCVPNDGYQFLYWDDGNVQQTRSIVITGNLTFTATVRKITTKTYTLSLKGSNCTFTGAGSYSPGSSATFRCIPNDGYRFVSWNDDNTSPNRTVVMNSDMTFTANVKPLNVYYTLTLSGEHCKLYGAGRYKEGTKVFIECIPDDGYVFTRWSNGKNTSTQMITMDSDKSISAWCDKEVKPVQSFNLVVKGNNCTVTGSGTYLYGTRVTVKCTPNAGHSFIFWDDGNTSLEKTVVVKSNMTVYAYCSDLEKDTYLYTTINDEKVYLAIADTYPSDYYLMWKDRFGGFQSQPFEMISTFSESLTKSNSISFNRIKKLYGVDVEPNWKIQTGWIKDNYMPFYESIFVSPNLLLYDAKNDKSYNVLVSESEWTEKTFENQGMKFFNLALNLKLNKNQNIRY